MELDLNDLPLESRDAIRSAALLGERFSLPVLREIGIETHALDSLFDQGFLIQIEGTEAQFASSDLLESEIRQMPWSQKRRISAKIAEVLAKRRADPCEVARHFVNAQEFGQARGFFTRAAEAATLDNDYHKALGLLNQAFELWPADDDPDLRKRLLCEMGRCARNVNDLVSCRLAWEELLEVSINDDDMLSRLEANRRLAELASHSHDRVEKRQRLQEAARLSSMLKDPLQEAKDWYSYGGFLLDNVRVQEAEKATDRALEAAALSKNPAIEVEILASNALCHAMQGNASEAFSRIEKSITIAIDNELPEQLAIAYRRKANIHEYSGEYHEYLNLELESLNRCRTGGWDGLEQSCLSCLSFAFFRLGKWKQSSDAVREAIELKGVDGELLAVATTVKACMAALQGKRKQAKALSDEALQLIRLHGGIVVEFYIYWTRAVAATIDGDAVQAQRAFGNLIGLWRETDDKKDALSGLVAAAGFYADTNNPKSLAECIDILSSIAAENSTIESNAAKAAAFAEDFWLRGKFEDAIRLENQAIEGYRKQGLLVEEALLGRRLGLMHASARDTANANSARSASMKIARDLGMRPLLDALENDRTTTEYPQSDTCNVTGIGLTTRQMDVLTLIGKGHTNKEAATQLSLSPRTVEMHVASILERLNCRARTDAIKKATELGLI